MNLSDTCYEAGRGGMVTADLGGWSREEDHVA